MLRKITLGGREIHYTLLRKKVKNINLRIKSDGNVFLSAPSYVPISALENFLISKEDFILSALARAALYVPEIKEYRNGEVFRILGEDKILRVEEGEKNTVSLQEGYIRLFVRNTSDTELKRKVLEKWQRELCHDKVLTLCREIYPLFQKRGISYPQIRMRKMVSRWGSCEPQKGILTFNTALVSAPLSCIEYVIMHEFAHFLVPNHSADFYAVLSAYMPDWKERKKSLEANKRS